MTRLLLLVALVASACGSRGPTVPSPDAQAQPVDIADRPQTVADAVVEPAAPPVSNADTEVVVADTTEVDARTLDTFRSILADAAAEDVADRSYGEIVQWTGEKLLGVPYVAGMLDAPPDEVLVVDLTGFDCVLYIENVLAISRMIALGQSDYADYADGIETLRYRDGQLDGYCSRLHYFSEWILNNEARDGLRNVTADIGGERFDKRLTFMGENRYAYPRMESDETYSCIVNMETSLADAELFYIPQDRIDGVYVRLQPGDIIATATSIGGLDVTHTGFVHKTDGGTGFMHASLSSDEVKISDDLQSYVQGIPSQIGVVVARPLDPRVTG